MSTRSPSTLTKSRLAFAHALAVTYILTPFLAAAPASASEVVRFSTSLGDIDVRLFNSATPASADNFLDLIDTGVFEETIFSRSVPGFVIQGGGFRFNDAGNLEISPGPPTDNLVPDSQGNLTGILNEPGLANIRGTIAFARSGEVDSATNQFFFSTANNRANLDFQNGGFAVFGQVLSGLDVVDEIADLPAADLSAALGSGAFTDTPLIDIDDVNGDGRITGIDTVDTPISFANFFSLDIVRTTFSSGDFNLDGLVGAQDFDVFSSQFGNTLQIDLLNAGAPGTDLDSDGNGDAIINVADFTVLRDALGAPSAAVTAAAGVPEPTGIAVLAAGIASAMWRRPRRDMAYSRG